MRNSRKISSRRINSDDFPTLLRWRNSESFRNLCTKRKETLTENQFRVELMEDFRFDRCEQILILVDGVPAGTAFAYRYSSIGKHVFVTVFLEEEYRGHAIGAYALADFVVDIFNHFKLFKVYFEVYRYNKGVVRLLTRLGLTIEGDFKGHCVHGGIRHDLLTFALYREVADRIYARLHRNSGGSVSASRTRHDISRNGVAEIQSGNWAKWTDTR